MSPGSRMLVDGEGMQRIKWPGGHGDERSGELLAEEI